MGVAALQGEAAFEAVCRLVSQATPFVWLARRACILPEGGAALQVLHVLKEKVTILVTSSHKAC